MKKSLLILLAFFLLVSNVHAGLWETVTNIPGNVTNAILDTLKQIIVDFVTPLLDLAKNFITSNPNPSDYEGFWQPIIILLSSFYLLIFIVVGIKFIVGSYDEVQRTEAKEWAKKAILIVILVNASLLIYSLVLAIGSATALSLWSTSYEELFQLQDLSALNIILLGLFTLSVLTALATLFIRYLLVLVGIMAFPIGLFLYFIPPVQAYGKIILNTLGVVIFLQFFDVLVLVASSLLLQEFGSLTQMQLLAPTMGFFLVAALNIFLLKFATMKALSESGTSVVISQVVKQITPTQKTTGAN